MQAYSRIAQRSIGDGLPHARHSHFIFPFVAATFAAIALIVAAACDRTVRMSGAYPILQRNALTADLSQGDLQRLADSAELVSLQHGEILYQPGQAISHVYFPGDSLIALLAMTDENMTLAVGLAGFDGMAGAPVALGATLSQVRAVVQKGGAAARIAADPFLRLLSKNPALQLAVHRYADALLVQATQTAVCSRFHMLDARLARALLMTRDRLRSDSFHLTHEFLAHALGVRRVGVTKAASALQNRKLIAYSRGDIAILDRPGLEAVACSCYQVVKHLNDAA